MRIARWPYSVFWPVVPQSLSFCYTLPAMTSSVPTASKITTPNFLRSEQRTSPKQSPNVESKPSLYMLYPSSLAFTKAASASAKRPSDRRAQPLPFQAAASLGFNLIASSCLTCLPRALPLVHQYAAVCCPNAGTAISKMMNATRISVIDSEKCLQEIYAYRLAAKW